MSEDNNKTYFIEYAKSGRSKCKTCKEPINKGDIRLCCSYPGSQGFDMTSSYHAGCFPLPRSFTSGANASENPAADFVDDILEDRSDGDILPAKRDEIIAGIEARLAAKKKTPGGRKSTGAGGGGASGKLGRIIAKYKSQQQENDDGLVVEEPPKKKKKKSTSTNDEEDTTIPQSIIDLYERYNTYKNDELKDILRWNRQHVTGTKNQLLMRILDGEQYEGRIQRCPMCGGRMKLDDDDGTTIRCPGSFNEELQIRVDCSYKTISKDALRWKPWLSEPPTEEQEAEMDKLDAEAKGEDTGDDDGANDEIIAKLVEDANKLSWNVSSRDGIRQAAADILQLLKNVGRKGDDDKKKQSKTIDLPSDDKQARKLVGSIIASHRSDAECGGDLIPYMIKEFGFVEDKANIASKKQEAAKLSTTCPENAIIATLFQELAQLYFKEGNRNAGLSYNKAVSAIQGLDYVITADNAMAMSKGKTKVPNIGKSTAEKIKEYMETGIIQKLEEKRADATSG